MALRREPSAYASASSTATPRTFPLAGRFTLLALMLAVLAAVIATFVRWVDRIARFGRMGSIIDKVEGATARAIRKRRRAPTMRSARVRPPPGSGVPVYCESIGYVQRVDVDELQAYALGAEVYKSPAATWFAA